MEKHATIEDVINSAKTNYEFSFLPQCASKKIEHEWSISSNARKDDIRIADLDCKHCQINLAVSLGLFAGEGF